MSSLIFKRASTSRTSGEYQDTDFDVRDDGKVVGRIYEDASVRRRQWKWSIAAIVPASPETHGTAATRDEAKAKFRPHGRRRRRARGCDVRRYVGQSKSACRRMSGFGQTRH
jgi:hypothetical protein